VTLFVQDMKKANVKHLVKTSNKCYDDEIVKENGISIAQLLFEESTFPEANVIQ